MDFKYKFLAKTIGDTDSFGKILTAVRDGKYPIALSGLSHIQRVVLSAVLLSKQKNKLLIITPGDAESERVSEDLSALGIDCVLFPQREFSFRSGVTVSHEYEHKRLGALSRVLTDEFDVLIASADAAVSSTVPKDTLKNRCFGLKVAEEVSVDRIVSMLVSGGYSRAEQVDGAGQFSVRGSIIDIFSPNLSFPCRIDLFGDEIDTISLFDPDTQRRTDSVNEVKIFPVSEIFPESTEDFKEKLKALLSHKKTSAAVKARITEDVARLEMGATIGFDAYIPLVFSENSTLFDYFSGTSYSTLVFDTNGCLDRIDNCLKLHFEEIKQLLEEGVLTPDFKSVYLDKVGFAKALKQHNTIYCDSFQKTSYDPAPYTVLPLDYRQNGSFQGSVASLCEDINSAGHKLTVILAGGEKAALNLTEELNENDISALFSAEPERVGQKGIFVTSGFLSAGFEIPECGLSVIVYGHAAPKKTKHRFKKGNFVGSLEELQRGDYVVHANHGIGIFSGVEQLTTHGVTRDYIKINYAGKDALYVPVTSLDMVSKYIGSAEDTNIKLNRLGSAEWTKTRSRVKKAVKDMAKQLTALYAKRMRAEGYAFSPDGDMQSDFERRFNFDETDDQLRCTAEIKKDMERRVPMDRLLCGDVGFGKTEVAFRAAFKAIADGKQCAILVPTTILAWQHFNNALERFGNMAVEVEMLSRFRTPKQQEKIKKNLAAGNIDLIIGTHSLISKDINFRDLGLIIVDEEQRFGVAQKEKLKELYPKVDALTLSATPIPRTLNMALSGLRDMSSIEEAPNDRRPVQTFVMEQNSGVIDEAISRELRRGGQVYYLHNRTENIETVASKIAARHENARVAVAHGKMSEEELSRVWQHLIEHEIDVLVCTTIIETGVDVPNVNTLIIEDSDRMGLAQLHQLRGRVGRSHRTAFAYLLYTPGKALSEISQKRLDAIRRFTEFGSGFKIAMRDLEIRGAGSILGGEQHGHMEAVGYDMYLKLLNDAIAEEKGEATEEQKDCTVDMRLSAHIPERYIKSLSGRLSAYRRIAGIRTKDDVLDVTDELIDRYGEPPAPVLTLIDVSYLRAVATKIDITEISEKDGRILLYTGGLTEAVAKIVSSPIKKRIMFSAGTKPYVSVRPDAGQKPIDTLKEALDIMSDGYDG